MARIDRRFGHGLDAERGVSLFDSKSQQDLRR